MAAILPTSKVSDQHILFALDMIFSWSRLRRARIVLPATCTFCRAYAIIVPPTHRAKHTFRRSDFRRFIRRALKTRTET